MRALALALAVLGTPAEACRLALALGLDVSGSVIGREYRLQLSGLASALRDADVQAAFLAVPDAPVALAVFEWSAATHQVVIRDWAAMESPVALDLAAAEIAAWGRRPAPEATALGSAMLFGAALLDRAPACRAATLDLSGDGRNNDGPPPTAVRGLPQLDRITVNALVVEADTGEAEDLEGYFRSDVIRGPGAFALRAAGYEDYARAMRLKLLKELETLAIGALDPGASAAAPAPPRAQ
ncbi:MAG: DUF1194 domain-containing protein [Paracoccaceae bacterium]|nr:DUF1194 domain-containing protein [Paracoccaceae bacterium]